MGDALDTTGLDSAGLPASRVAFGAARYRRQHAPAGLRAVQLGLLIATFLAEEAREEALLVFLIGGCTALCDGTARLDVRLYRADAATLPGGDATLLGAELGHQALALLRGALEDAALDLTHRQLVGRALQHVDGEFQNGFQRVAEELLDAAQCLFDRVQHVVAHHVGERLTEHALHRVIQLSADALEAVEERTIDPLLHEAPLLLGLGDERLHDAAQWLEDLLLEEGLRALPHFVDALFERRPNLLQDELLGGLDGALHEPLDAFLGIAVEEPVHRVPDRAEQAALTDAVLTLLAVEELCSSLSHASDEAGLRIVQPGVERLEDLRLQPLAGLLDRGGDGLQLFLEPAAELLDGAGQFLANTLHERLLRFAILATEQADLQVAPGVGQALLHVGPDAVLADEGLLQGGERVLQGRPDLPQCATLALQDRFAVLIQALELLLTEEALRHRLDDAGLDRVAKDREDAAVLVGHVPEAVIDRRTLPEQRLLHRRQDELLRVGPELGHEVLTFLDRVAEGAAATAAVARDHAEERRAERLDGSLLELIPPALQEVLALLDAVAEGAAAAATVFADRAEEGLLHTLDHAVKLLPQFHEETGLFTLAALAEQEVLELLALAREPVDDAAKQTALAGNGPVLVLSLFAEEEPGTTVDGLLEPTLRRADDGLVHARRVGWIPDHGLLKRIEDVELDVVDDLTEGTGAAAGCRVNVSHQGVLDSPEDASPTSFFAVAKEDVGDLRLEGIHSLGHGDHRRLEDRLQRNTPALVTEHALVGSALLEAASLPHGVDVVIRCTAGRPTRATGRSAAADVKAASNVAAVDRVVHSTAVHLPLHAFGLLDRLVHFRLDGVCARDRCLELEGEAGAGGAPRLDDVVSPLRKRIGPIDLTARAELLDVGV